MTRRKSGGREARIALRSTPLTEEEKPVKPGEIGGRYKPLSDKQVQAIEVNVYRILEEIGFADATPHCIETCVAFGAVMGDDGRLRMPKEVVKKAMDLAQHSLTLHGQSPKFDLDLSSSKVHFSTAGAAVMMPTLRTMNIENRLVKIFMIWPELPINVSISICFKEPACCVI